MASELTTNDASDPRANDASRASRRVLYLVHRTPFPPNRGDRIRSYHILRYLSKRFRLHVAALSDEPVPAEHEQVLRDMCEDVCVLRQPSLGRWSSAACSFLRGRTATQGLFWSRPLRNVLRQWSSTECFDAVVACCSSMGQYLLLPELKAIPSVVDLIDVDSQKWIDYASSSRGLKANLYQSEGRRLRELEAKLTDHAKAMLLVNEEEARLFRSVVPNQKTLAVANGVDVDYFKPMDQELLDGPPKCVFVGVLDYRPNVDGLRWFCREVWPAVLEHAPAAALSIVGRRPAEAVLQLNQLPGVSVVSDVPDVRPYVAEATLSIAPLQIARGTQNKVLEAMAMGKAVVATSLALEGIDAVGGTHVFQADTPDEWVTAIARLAEDNALRQGLGAKARQFVCDFHDWSACLERFGDLLDSHAAAVVG